MRGFSVQRAYRRPFHIRFISAHKKRALQTSSRGIPWRKSARPEKLSCTSAKHACCALSVCSLFLEKVRV